MILDIPITILISRDVPIKHITDMQMNKQIRIATFELLVCSYSSRCARAPRAGEDIVIPIQPGASKANMQHFVNLMF